MGTFSKGQRVVGEYRGHEFSGVITNTTERLNGLVVSVKLDSEIQVRGERGLRNKFMCIVDNAGRFGGAVSGFMEPEPIVQPPDVDMGGDFEGFVEAVNQPQAAQAQKWYTDEVTSADGEKIRARVTRGANGGGNLIEVLASGITVWGESETVYGWLLAQARAREMAVAYLNRLNAIRAAEMGDETETIYPLLVDKAGRKAQLEAHIARLRRELQDYEYELSELVEVDAFINVLRWLATQKDGADSEGFKSGAGVGPDMVSTLRKRGFIERINYEWMRGAIFSITELGLEYLKAQGE